MNTFLGNTEVKVDEKGRIFIPSNYRKILTEMDSKRIVVRRDTDNECLIFYPEPTWNTKVAALRDALDEWNPDDQLILMQFMAEAEILEMDGQGRVLLSGKAERLRGGEAERQKGGEAERQKGGEAERQKGGEATNNTLLFVGMLDRFALWSPKNFEEKKLSQAELATNIRKRMIKKS